MPSDNTIEMDEAISTFVNRCTTTDLKDLGIAMAKDHRTLVQSKMRFVMAFLGELSDMYAHGQCDLRNEAACTAADKMLSALSEFDKSLPFV